MANSHGSADRNCMLAGLLCAGNVHLIIGANPLAASRCTQSLTAGACPILLAPEGDLPSPLQAKIDDGAVRWERKAFEDEDLFRLGRSEVGGVVDAVFVTDHEESAHISEVCKRNRIPVNVVDAPNLCTFSLLSTHVDGCLQIGVTTNGRGCKLASRIRREIASSLPANLGQACLRLGEVRRRIQAEDGGVADLEDSAGQTAQFNKLVVEEQEKGRRMRWLSQVCEYWPLKRLASVGDEEVETLLKAYLSTDADTTISGRDGEEVGRRGRIILAGSGPGHPHLLTRATHRAIQTADLVLADKLVPSGVMDLIPRRTDVRIARKFPGNADQAQDELHAAALDAARQGKTVLRLKQGDPYVYGRGGEEVAHFRAHGLREEQILVLPGVTSALSAPLFAGIPSTQRDVADSVLICTGTGKKGTAPAPPEYVPSRTVVFLMALHRVGALVQELTTNTTQEKRSSWPLDVPCAVVERASCPDQRVIRTTLRHVAEAVEEEGSRPPGLLVVGSACEVLHQRGGGRAWVVEEGFRGLPDLDVGLNQDTKV